MTTRTRFALPIAHRPACRTRVPTRRHARVALVWGAAAFVAASAGLALALETVRPEWRDPEFGHRMARLAHAPGPVVLVVGSSRTQFAIAPAAMCGPGEVPRVFNFGQSAATPLKQLLTLHRVLDAGVVPAAVVVELFPPVLAADGPAEAVRPGQAPRLGAGDFDVLAPYLAPGAVRGDWLRARANPWHAQRQLLLLHWAAAWLPADRRLEAQWAALDAHGFQPLPGAPPEYRDRAWAHARREYADAFIGFHPREASRRAVRNLIAACRERSVPVAFFVPPISPAFRAAFAPGVLDAAERELLALAGGRDVPVFPAPLDVREDEFMDGHHMLRHGAERYSRWLADAHLTPWLGRLGGTQ